MALIARSPGNFSPSFDFRAHNTSAGGRVPSPEDLFPVDPHLREAIHSAIQRSSRQQRAVDDAPVAPALFAEWPVGGDDVCFAVPLLAEHFLRIGFCCFWMGIGQSGFKHRPPPTRSVVMPISSYPFLQASRTSLTFRGILKRYYRWGHVCEFAAVFLRGFPCLRALSSILAAWIP